MYAFDTYYDGSEVVLNKKHRHPLNEVLVQILNCNFPDLKKWRGELSRFYPKLSLESDMDFDKAQAYNENAQATQRLMHRIDSMMGELPFYQEILSPWQQQGGKLLDVLNSIKWPWKYESEEDVEDDCDASFSGLEHGTEYFSYLNTFVPDLDVFIDEGEMLTDLGRFNEDLRELLEQYIALVDDLLRAEFVYATFVNEYLGSHGRFLTESELAEVYLDFMKRYGKESGGAPYLTFCSGKATMSHAVLERSSGGRVLCEAYHFETLGAFLYHNLFRGIAQRYIPKKCQNCGRYFLIQAGKYSDYCDCPTESDPAKTCREIGSRKRYDSKCKNDPVWLAYNRAYKAHYARYMKKKMTVAEFEQWSAWAVELRTRAENGEIDFESYQKEIRT